MTQKNKMNNEQAKIDIYLSQPETKMAVDMLSIKYDFVVDELAKSILEEEIIIDEAADFLVEEFSFNEEDALNLVDKLSENIIEPFYAGSELIEAEEEIVETSNKPKQTNWRNFIRPKVLNTGMEELTKASSGDVARVRNYLWKNLGLNKAEEVVVVLSWLATTEELVKLWKEDNRFRGILRKYISQSYTDDMVEKVLGGKVTPAALSLALQMVLKAKLGLSDQDSAMVSMSIIDRLPDEDKPKYILIGYVDAKNNSFHWNNIQESANGLELTM